MPDVSRYLVLDLGATHHMFYHPNQSQGETVQITTLSGTTHGKLSTTTTCRIYTSDDDVIRLRFASAIRSAKFNTNLISLVQLASEGWNIDIQKLELRDPADRIYPITVIDNLFCLEITKDIPDEEVHIAYHQAHNQNGSYAMNSTASAEILRGMQLLHLRLGHFSERKIYDSILAGAKFGPEALTAKPTKPKIPCAGCLKGKCRKPHKQRHGERAELEPGELIHIDLKEKVETSYNGCQYWVHFTDDKTRFSMPFALKTKDGVASAFRQFIVEAQSNRHTVRSVRCDNASILVHGKMKAVLKEFNISDKPSPKYDPEANGRAESAVGVFWDHAIAVLESSTNVPHKFWPLILKTLAMIRNNLIHSATGKIPAAEWLIEGVQDLSLLRVIGSTIYIYIPKHLRTAHQPRSQKFIFVGMKNPYTAYLKDPDSDTIIERGHMAKSIELFNADGTIANIDTHKLLRIEGGAATTATSANQDTSTTLPATSAEGGVSETPTEGGVHLTSTEGGASIQPTDKDPQRTTPWNSNIETNSPFSSAGHEEYMPVKKEWKKLEHRYGPHTFECHRRTDKANALMPDRPGCSPSDPFQNYTPRRYENLFIHPPYSEAQQHLDHAVKCFENDHTITATAIVPSWKRFDVSKWQLVDTIPAGTKFFQNPNGSKPTATKWDVNILRLNREEEMPEPREITRNLKLIGIRILKIGVHRDGELLSSISTIRTDSHGILTVFNTALLERYPSTWKLLIEHSGQHPQMLRQVRVKGFSWSNEWTGLTTSYDANKREYDICFSNGQVSIARRKDIEPIQPTTALASMAAADCDPNPILTYENRNNIYIPDNSRDLEKMPDGPLKSLYMTAGFSEAENLRQQKVYREVRRDKVPAKRRIIKSRIVYTIKWDPMTGLMDKPKARIVACGYSQVYGIDFTDTYASTPKLSTARFFIHCVVQYSLKMIEFDIKAAYLHSILEESIFMYPPHGMPNKDENGNEIVWELLKSLYGLRQAGHNWMNDLFSFLKQYGLTQDQCDTSLWSLHDSNGEPQLILFVHTDDGKLAFKDRTIADKFMDALSAKFNVGSRKDSIDRIFNIKVDQRPDGTIKLSQTQYIMDLAAQYNIVANTKITTPMQPDFKMEVKDALTEDEKIAMRKRPFLSLLSALLWLCRCTRYDIAVSLCILSRASSNPNPSHWDALIRILKYLINTKDRGIAYQQTSTPNKLCVFSDSSHANDPVTLRSIGGHLTTIGGNILDWSSRHQPYIALHSGEAETIQAASVGTTHILYWRQLFDTTLKFIPEATLLLDSTTAQAILSEPIHTTLQKHIRIRLFFVREHYKANELSIKHIPGTENPSDMLTKPLPIQTIIKLRRMIRVWGGDSNYQHSPSVTLGKRKTSAASTSDSRSSKRARAHISWHNWSQATSAASSPDDIDFIF